MGSDSAQISPLRKKVRGLKIVKNKKMNPSKKETARYFNQKKLKEALIQNFCEYFESKIRILTLIGKFFKKIFNCFSKEWLDQDQGSWKMQPASLGRLNPDPGQPKWHQKRNKIRKFPDLMEGSEGFSRSLKVLYWIWYFAFTDNKNTWFEIWIPDRVQQKIAWIRIRTSWIRIQNSEKKYGTGYRNH
jgi:hypothetical protein